MPHTRWSISQSQLRNSKTRNRRDVTNKAASIRPVKHLDFFFQSHAGYQGFNPTVISLRSRTCGGESRWRFLYQRCGRSGNGRLFKKSAATYCVCHGVAHNIR
jgi:hypothetical protein